MDIKAPILTPRLNAAAKLVRSGSFVADVGTDHAYLPIYLVLSGKSKGGVASDINEGPYKRALSNVKVYALSDKITTRLTPGLSGIEEFHPTDIIICGMGGELIASIIDAAPWTKDPSIRLVLQPMTHSEILRKYLLDNKFSIVGERVAKEEKIYEIICAEYSGTPSEQYSDVELLVGKNYAEKNTDIYLELISHHISTLKKIADAKRSASASTDKEDRLIKELEELKNDSI